jgi:hypothetical protein
VDAADAAPTTQASQTFSNVETALREQLAAWEQTKSKDLPELNRKLKAAGLPSLNPELTGMVMGSWDTEPKARGSEEP